MSLSRADGVAWQPVDVRLGTLSREENVKGRYEFRGSGRPFVDEITGLWVRQVFWEAVSLTAGFVFGLSGEYLVAWDGARWSRAHYEGWFT